MNLIEYSYKVIRLLVLIMLNIGGYVNTFKVKDGDKDKNNKMMSFRKTFQTKIEDLKNIQLIALPVYNDRYLKTKIRTCDDKVYNNFRGSDVLDDDIECESFTVISIESLLLYKNKYYLLVYLDNCAYKIANKKMTEYLGDNIFEDQILEILYCDRIDISKGIDPTRIKEVKNARFATIGFLIMDSNFKILYAMVAMIGRFCVLNISDIAIIVIKNVDYRCIIRNSKSEAINLLTNSVL